MITMTEKKLLRVLHVGVANRGEWPLKLCNESTGFTPAALCDMSADALASARQITGLTESDSFTDFDEALKLAHVDCAIICAPTLLHVPLASKAIEAGLPVLVEKGMAPDWANAQRLAMLVRDRNAIAAVGQNYRYNRMERTLARAIQDSSAPAHPGKVHNLTYSQHRVRPNPRTLTFPFASVWDMSCHHFDNMFYWLGPIKEMTAFSWHADWSAYKFDNNSSAQIVFENGTNVHYIHSHDAARSSLDIQIHGERGALVTDGEQITFNERPLEQFGSRLLQDVAFEPANGEADLLRDFHRYITDGLEPGTSVRNNLETMAACEMMVRSITQKRMVRREELDA
ncbi:MAG: Gfo/Idh/MocA family oxidoreductase [Anaerolineae bacterium]|nr:Gfo/Idh/MocA family oxidoreductase [Phycisphaerae bacterium]